MDSELFDLIARTRPTILEILDNRGYNTESYKNTSPEDLIKLATTSTSLLRICAERKEGGPAPMNRCCVLYWVEGVTRLRIENEIMKLYDEESPDHYDPTHDELIIILSEPFNDVFHIQAAKVWSVRSARISFFHIKHLVSNPSRHQYVPVHRKLTEEEIATVLEKYYIRGKNEFPRILYHVDMQARVLGLVPGDIVEIRRPSPTSGEYIAYRVCSLA